MGLGVTFLWPNKKVTKEVGLRGTYAKLPLGKCVLLRISRAHYFASLQDKLHPDSRENVPIFSGMGSAVQTILSFYFWLSEMVVTFEDGWAEIGTFPPKVLKQDI